VDEVKIFFDTLIPNSSDFELYVRILFQVILLTSSAVFSGSETAMFSLSRIDLQKLRQSRHKDSESLHAMLDEPRRLIISILCGNELVNIASAVNMTGILLLLFGGQDVAWINILIMVPLLLLMGEVTPKTIAVSYPIKFYPNYSKNLTSMDDLHHPFTRDSTYRSRPGHHHGGG